MIKIKQLSRTHFKSEDGKVDIYLRESGQKVDQRGFSGKWAFSQKDGDMKPFLPTYSLEIDRVIYLRDILEDEFEEALRLYGFKLK